MSGFAREQLDAMQTDANRVYCVTNATGFYADEQACDVALHVLELAAEVERLQSENHEILKQGAEWEGLALTRGQEIESMRAIIERLPKTADGVPITPGDSVFIPSTQTLLTVGCIQNTWGGRVMWREDHATRLRDGCECYSTREAAEKARGQ